MVAKRLRMLYNEVTKIHQKMTNLLIIFGNYCNCHFLIKIKSYFKEEETKMVIKMEIVSTLTAAQGKLTYQIIKSVHMGVTVYGIKVINELFNKTEECLVSDVTCDKDAADRLLSLCAENAVLPITLQNVCEDFIVTDAMSA
jgi:hypothetical protein